VLAAESDFGADRVWKFETNLPASAKPLDDRLAAAMAPLGISRGRGIAGDGTDVGPLHRTGVGGVDLVPVGTALFRSITTRPTIRSTRSIRSSCARMWQPGPRCSPIVANAPEDIGPVTPQAFNGRRLRRNASRGLLRFGGSVETWATSGQKFGDKPAAR
jgi:carboxypeptidase Q